MSEELRVGDKVSFHGRNGEIIDFMSVLGDNCPMIIWDDGGLTAECNVSNLVKVNMKPPTLAQIKREGMK